MKNSAVTQFRKNQFQEAERAVLRLLSNLIQHGYFKMEVTGAIIKQGKREVTIEAGKSYRFIIPVEDLPRTDSQNDSCDLSVVYEQNLTP